MKLIPIVALLMIAIAAMPKDWEGHTGSHGQDSELESDFWSDQPEDEGEQDNQTDPIPLIEFDHVQEQAEDVPAVAGAANLEAVDGQDQNGVDGNAQNPNIGPYQHGAQLQQEQGDGWNQDALMEGGQVDTDDSEGEGGYVSPNELIPPPPQHAPNAPARVRRGSRIRRTRN